MLTTLPVLHDWQPDLNSGVVILVFKGHKAWPSGRHAITAVQYNVIKGYV